MLETHPILIVLAVVADAATAGSRASHGIAPHSWLRELGYVSPRRAENVNSM